MVGLALLNSSCKNHKTNEWVLLVDQTDTSIPKPTIHSLQPKLELDKNKWNGIKVKKVVISNVKYGEEKILEIPSKKAFYSNEFERKKEIEQFILNLDTMMQVKEEEDYKQSIIFPIIVREANILSKSTLQGKKRLIIYSDLIENTNLISFRKLPFSSNENDMDLWSKLENHYDCTLLEDLKSIEISIVYRTKDFNHSQRFSKIAEIYKQKFEEKGAKVNITSTI